MNAAQEATPTAAGNAANPFASLFGGLGAAPPPASGAHSSAVSAGSATSASAAPNTAPLPNPWAPAAASGAPPAGVPTSCAISALYIIFISW